MTYEDYIAQEQQAMDEESRGWQLLSGVPARRAVCPRTLTIYACSIIWRSMLWEKEWN